jgi:2'-5' RNA ligase
MRAFIAVPMPSEVKDYLFNLKKQFKGGRVNWVHKKNIHLTLAFLGEITEEQSETIQKRLSEIKFKPIKAKLTDLGFFPNLPNPKCIWVDLAPGLEIKQLQMLVDQEIIDISPQSQEFKTHVTIGRIKGFKKKKDFLDSVADIEIEPIEFTIDSFEFIKSELTRTGPKYKMIKGYRSQ